MNTLADARVSAIQKMKSIVLEQPGQFINADVADLTGAGADEALVRVRRVGVCGTDLHAFKGVQPFFTYPRVLGHELGVEILEVGANNFGLSAGDVCSVEPYLNCGHCIACRRTRPNCCVRMQVLGIHLDGGMRECLRVPLRKLHKANNLTLDQLALVEPLSIGAHAVERAQIKPDETVLIIGTGPIGLAVTLFAQLAGASVMAMDTSDERLQFCREHFSVESTINAGTDDVLERLKELTSGDLPVVVFDATGNRASMMRDFELVAHGGRLIFVGLFQGEVSFHDPNFHARELNLLASRNAMSADFRKVISLMEAGKINADNWVSHRVPAAQMIAQFPNWLDPQTKFIKALVEF